MIVDLDCGCRIDDEFYSTFHQKDGLHYPIGTGPKSFCRRCDLYKPCVCTAEDTAVVLAKGPVGYTREKHAVAIAKARREKK